MPRNPLGPHAVCFVITDEEVFHCPRLYESRVDSPAAGRRPAQAPLPVRMVRLSVIEQYLLARFDVPQSEKQDVAVDRSEEHTSELQSLRHLVCRLLLEKK